MIALPIAERRVGELVAEDFRRAGVFSRYGIDFCCGGGISLTEACRRLGLDPQEVARELTAAERSSTQPTAHRFNTWSPAFLADYIVNEHHTFVRENLPVLLAFTQKVARVHGADRPALVVVAGLVEELAREMEAHMASEEEVVFPRIKSGEGEPLESLIEQMEDEHDHAGEIMRQIRQVTDDYALPEGACNTYRASFAKLEEFEADLHIHVHLENNVLFPRAVELEGRAAA